MIEIKLKNTNGESLGTLNFPTSAKEVTLKTYFKYEVAREELDNFAKENAQAFADDPVFMSGYLLRMERCVRAWCSDDRLQELPVGDASAFLAGHYRVRLDQIDLKTAQATISSLFANILRVLSSYERYTDATPGKAYTFVYKGRLYSLKPSYRDAVTKQRRYESVTTAQAVEALEAFELYRKVQGKDTNRAFVYTTILNLTSCFALAEGEQFPAGETQIRRWISDRIVHFEDLDMETGLNVLAFFFSGAQASKQTKQTGGSLSRQRALAKTRRRVKP